MLAILTRLPIIPAVVVLVDAIVSVANDPISPFAPLINVGAIGCVLLWFLLRAEPRLRAIEVANDRQSRAVLLVIIAIQSVPDHIKDQAKELVSEIDKK